MVLARHGESAWNVAERYQGHGDSGLTSRGRAQAEQLAAWLVDTVGFVDRVVSSDLPRARDTAAAEAARTSNPHPPTVCVFTHGGPIRVAAAAAAGAEPPGHQAMAPATNGSLTVLDLGVQSSRIVQYNAQIVPADRPSRAE